MTAITVRLSDKEKQALEKYGKVSDVVRQAIRTYLNDKKSREVIKKLQAYQSKNPVKTTREEIIALIREDRNSH